jgi:predicted outer membrane protein
MRSRSIFGLLTLLSLTLAPAAAWAQEVRTQQDPAQRQQQRESLDRQQSPQTTGRQARAGQGDEELVNYLAGKLALMNQMEIELAQLGQTHATDQDIKQLAQRIGQSHQELNQKLAQAMPQLSSIEGLSGQRIAAQGGRQGQADQRPQAGQQAGQERRADQPGQPGQIDRQTAGTDTQRGATTIRGQSGEELNAHTLLDICRRSAENHLQMAKQSLQSKQGKDFDACWVGAQVCAHQAMVAELKALQNVGSPEFQQIVQAAEQESQQHLQQVEQVAQRLMSSSSAGTTRE